MLLGQGRGRDAHSAGAGSASGRKLWQASSPAVATAMAVAKARARLLGCSDGDGEGRQADVEQATKKWAASQRWPWHGEQASTGNGKQLDWSQIRAVGSCCQSTAVTERN